MYWFLNLNAADLLLFAALSLAWAGGGWLLVVHVFRLRPAERLVTGLATGLLLFLTVSNLLANLLPLTISLWLAGLLILASGLGAAFRAQPQVRFPWQDFKFWQPLASLGLLIILFTLIQRGLALFDEFLHMPMVSIMAAGDIPPHFYLDPAVKFTYHYGLQVFAAALIRLAGFTPWAALDVSKAITISFTAVLGYTWILRKTNQRFPALTGAFALIFAGGRAGCSCCFRLSSSTGSGSLSSRLIPARTAARRSWRCSPAPGISKGAARCRFHSPTTAARSCRYYSTWGRPARRGS